MGARTKRGYSRPRRGTAVASNKGGLPPVLNFLLSGQDSNTEFRFAVIGQINNIISPALLAVTGTVDVWDETSAEVRPWDVTLDIPGGNVILESPDPVDAASVVIIQPWALYLRGPNGEWLQGLAFVAPGP
jgi:hypothetical protein